MPNTLRPGGLLVEAMLAIVVFGVFVSASYLTLLTGQESTRYGSQRIRGVHYALQGIEVVKSIRNEDFALLTTGDHGYEIDADTGKWTFTGSSVTRFNFTNTINISTLTGGTVKIDSTVTWKEGIFRRGNIGISSILTDWHTDVGVGDWSSITETGNWTAGDQVDFNDIYAYKDYLYITNQGSTYGDGLYILDISNPAIPSRVSGTFTINANTFSPIAYRNRLYIATAADPDIIAYDIASPTILNPATTTLASTSTTSGGNHAKSLSIKNEVLYVGGDGSSGVDEIMSYSIQTGSLLTQLDTLDLTGNLGIDDLYIDGTIAYAGASNGFLYMIDISDPSNLNLITSRQMGIQSVTGIRYAGTGFYATLESGLDEYTLRSSNGGTTPIIPNSDGGSLQGVDLAGNGNDLDSDPYGCYNFIATGNSSKELQVRSVEPGLTELTSANLSTGQGRAVHYNAVEDQLYVATESGVYIYDPGSPSTCP